MGVVQRWIQALKSGDWKTVGELTASEPEDERLAELKKEKPDEATLKALAQEYGDLTVDRTLPPRAGGAVPVVARRGAQQSQEGESLQILVRREGGKWRVIDIRDPKRERESAKPAAKERLSGPSSTASQPSREQEKKQDPPQQDQKQQEQQKKAD
jgi:hypothetical protein